MGHIRKINDVYYIEFYARGLLYSQVAGASQEDAQKLLEQIEAKIAGGEALTIARHIDLEDFFERFLAEAKSQHSPKTLQRFGSTVKYFSAYLREQCPEIRRLDQITPAVVESYKAYLARVQKSKIVNLTLLLLRDILEFGIKLGFINDNPSLHVRLLPWPSARERKPTARFKMAQQLLAKSASLGKAAQLLKVSDVSRLMYYANSIPLSREDVYN